jgi:uncharacterized protein YecT (DUF1311 family)
MKLFSIFCYRSRISTSKGYDMTDVTGSELKQGGFGLGVTSLVIGILAAVLSLGHEQNSIRYASFFAALALMFGFGSLYQGTRKRSSAIAGILLAIGAGAYIVTILLLNNRDVRNPPPAAATYAPNQSIPMEKKTAPEETAWTPSYDCQRVSSGPERMVCSNKELASLDVQLNEAYSYAAKRVADRKTLKIEQLAWLKNIRNNCSDSECMLLAYRARLSELRAK